MKLVHASVQARMWRALSSSSVECLVTPRHCKIRPGRTGFCGVRKNVNGVLYTLNYGKSVQVVQDHIETEGVFHYAPGAPILSLGNVGCMFKCDF